ncbi:regulatory protein RecX [Candidatus Sodalis pierantonius]|uniref:regulatory protein RecX n=1 Tax=Candidatus Sodalis pierantonii TaxID=1486991 RepID=UPI00046D1B86|nr:regulatory protein RecX [Candidatus Sodalis pierantonius]
MKSFNRRAVKTTAQPATAVSQDEIDQAIAYCHDHDWLDDGRFARRYVSRRSKQGYGEQRIRMELLQKGINRDDINAAFAEAEIDRTAQAFAVAVKKFGQPLPAEPQSKIKVQSYLLSRGFSFDEIRSIYTNL